MGNELSFIPPHKRLWRRAYWRWHRRRADKGLIPAEIRTLARRAGPLVYLDCGAAGGPSQTWNALANLRLCEAYGLEPDATAERPGRMKYLAVAVGDAPRKATLNITRYAECSSVLEPDSDVLADYAIRDWFDVVRRETITLTTIDKLCFEHAIPTPDYLKIDVQGFELAVLRGAEGTLPFVTGIELEGHYRQLYRGQALLPEIVAHLERHGFDLRAERPRGPFGGDIVEADAFFTRRDAVPAKRELFEALFQLS